MTKKSTSFMIEPDVIKKIKYLSIDHEKPIGDIIEDLVKFSESGEGLKICAKCKSVYGEEGRMVKI